MASVYIRNCYNKNTRKSPYESFIGSKPNLNKIHIFGMTCFFYVQNKTKLILVVQKASLSAMINSKYMAKIMEKLSPR